MSLCFRFFLVSQGNFEQRVKAYSLWQGAQNTLAKKRETEQKLQAGGKPEKIAQNKAEIKEVGICFGSEST